MGHKVGVLDSDIYGPSMQRVLGVTGKPDNAEILNQCRQTGVQVCGSFVLVPKLRLGTHFAKLRFAGGMGKRRS